MALKSNGQGIFNIVDDEPAPAREWMPVYAESLEAKRPLKVPTVLARMVAGSYPVYVMTRQRGANNRLAKVRLDWSPKIASWREGFFSAN